MKHPRSEINVNKPAYCVASRIPIAFPVIIFGWIVFVVPKIVKIRETMKIAMKIPKTMAFIICFI